MLYLIRLAVDSQKVLCCLWVNFIFLNSACGACFLLLLLDLLKSGPATYAGSGQMK